MAAFHRMLIRGALAAGLVLASSLASAQGVVTLYGGARAGGEFVDDNSDQPIKLASGATASVSYDWLFSDGQQGQIFYSFQRSALPGSVLGRADDIAVNISYLHLGGRVFFDGSYATNAAYLVGGLGLTLFTPRAGELSTEVRPSANLGLGYQWMLSKQVMLRTEVRGYMTLVNSTGGFFCSGGCVVSIRGDTVQQADAMVGLSFGF